VSEYDNLLADLAEQSARPGDYADLAATAIRQLIAERDSGSGENIFGKMRGRFNEAAARAHDRTLNEKAMAAVCAMPEDQFAVFAKWFGDLLQRRNTRP
jgi:hypothetical protein